MDGLHPPFTPRQPEPDATDRAIQKAKAGDSSGAIAWALIAIATELATIRRDLRKRR